MNNYIVTCRGAEDESSSLRHDPCTVAWIDDDRTEGKGIRVEGAFRFEAMKPHAPNERGGQMDYRLRCYLCGEQRNIQWAENTVAEVIDKVAELHRIGRLRVVRLPPLPPELEGRNDADVIRNRMADALDTNAPEGAMNCVTGTRVEIPFTLLEPLVERLRGGS